MNNHENEDVCNHEKELKEFKYIVSLKNNDSMPVSEYLISQILAQAPELEYYTVTVSNISGKNYCDNANCNNIAELSTVVLTEEFEYGICHWCDECLDRDSNMILCIIKNECLST